MDKNCSHPRVSFDAEPPEMSNAPVTDAVVADAIGAHATESSGHHRPVHTHCENCGTELRGPFCHRCGQHDIDFRRSFGHMFLDALENFFHFDEKLFRNIVTLLFRPGVLTAEFNAGKRAAQMPPLRFYIFISVLFFFVSLLGGNHADQNDLYRSDEPKTGSVISQDGKVPAGELREALTEAAADIARENKDPAKAAKIRAALEKISQAAAQSPPTTPTASAEAGQPPANPAQKKPIGMKGTKGDTSDFVRELDARSKHDTSAFIRDLNERGKHVMENPLHFVDSLLHALPKMLLVCLPFFALYTRVLFRKSGQAYLQHLIVALHFHTFVFLWWLVAHGWHELVGLLSPGLAGLLGFLTGLWMFLYPFRMLRHLFGQSWTKIVLKVMLLASAYACTLGLALFATAAIIFFNT